MTDFKTGLTSAQVEDKLIEFGENTLVKPKKVSWIGSFFKQFLDPMVILLVIAAFVSLGLAIFEHVHSSTRTTTEIIVSYVEPGIIFLVIALNSALGAYQEVKSDQAVRALAAMNETNATVRRNGEIIKIPATQLVPGDVMLLNAGDVISADGRLIDAFNLRVIESSLTGESVAVDKKANFDAPKNEVLAQNTHLVFSGTYVTNGKAEVLVEETGTRTELGKINAMIQSQNKTLTPLQLKLNKLSKIFGWSGIVLLFISFIIYILLNNIVLNTWSNPDVYTSSAVTAISLAVAAIPEGLITFTTVLLSIGVSKISKQNGLVKNLLAVETLGSVNVICSDKTGTLTENKMTVVDGYINNKLLSKTTGSAADRDFHILATYLTLCNDASISYDQNTNTFKEIGDPTETGLLWYAYGLGIYKESLLAKTPILDTLTFDSDRKLMSVLVEKENHTADTDPKSNLIIVKGAPDVVLARCKNLESAQLEQINRDFGQKSYRVLAVATRETTATKLSYDDEQDLTFVGLIAMIDPPRANVAKSIAVAQKAGVKTVMITGDHIHTAQAIAKDLGIWKEGDLTVSGEELARMSDIELASKVHLISVYARVNPSDKLRIVNAWQSHEKVVAMTGDGVNDAPALKASDIGCAMGITGTDVSKQAADLVLVDDNFNTIVNSIKNGRMIFDKIKIVILNLLISSLSEVLVMLVGLIAFYLAFKERIGSDGFYIFSASQLLWINLLTHGLPAIALGLIDSDKDVMNRSPYSKKESIFARGMGYNLLAQGCVLSFFTLLAYGLGGVYAAQLNLTGLEFLKVASTAAFLTLGIGASLNSINLMSTKTIFSWTNLKKNWIVFVAAGTSVFSVLLVVLVPNLSSVFRMVDNVYYYPLILAIGLTLALTLTIYNEIYKVIVYFWTKHKTVQMQNLAQVKF
ncbi:cation-translocating P-type ATPase [Mycoplasmopsis columbinasalis]|uniref:Calcium-transporting ATPase n=1 Tax=Mycoplasmopsis columbinasalis TaxID=114880 RepID=A0A449BAS8_9BACT|nr:cation-translocating P-type ATPase [Mycoplasmopsis columbinasalis]VEU78297.1 Calcium-transporting ATPase [Mycoplasmopsis columbinasalis]